MDKYQVGRLLFHSSSTDVSVHEGTSPLGVPVIIKTYECMCPEEASEQLFEAMMQVRVEHPNTCRLLDLKMTTISGRALKVHLVMERLDRDLRKEIRVRASEKRYFAEGEVLTLVHHIASGLAYAKSKVRPMTEYCSQRYQAGKHIYRFFRLL